MMTQVISQRRPTADRICQLRVMMAPGSVDMNPVLVIPGPRDFPEMSVGFHFFDDLSLCKVTDTTF